MVSSAKNQETNSFTRDQYLVFEVNNEKYCIGINNVKEIRNYSPISKIPNSVEYMLGVIEIRGEVIPVFDFKKRFNLPKDNANEVFILVNFSGDTVGIVVEKVIDIKQIANDQIQSPETFQSSLHEKYVKGVYFEENTSHILLNENNIFSKDEIEKSKAIGAESLANLDNQ
jgi:purine-binding chemotaxis protein CheW